jgi:hypothetical protein
MAIFGSRKVVVTTAGTTKQTQFRFPRCKSKRIRNKWMKNKENFKVEYVCLLYRDPTSSIETIIIHPVVEQQIKNGEYTKTPPRKEPPKKEPLQQHKFHITSMFGMNIRASGMFSPFVCA